MSEHPVAGRPPKKTGWNTDRKNAIFAKRSYHRRRLREAKKEERDEKRRISHDKYLFCLQCNNFTGHDKVESQLPDNVASVTSNVTVKMGAEYRCSRCGAANARLPR